MPPIKKTAYSYVRWSSAKQKNNDSLQRQIDYRDKWLKKNPDYVLDQKISLKDDSVSAYRGKNLDKHYGDLGRFIEVVEHENSPIPPDSVLLIERLDRFSRGNAMTAVNAIHRLIINGVRVVCTADDLEITEENSGDLKVILPVIVALCLAHEESKTKSKRIQHIWDEKRKEVYEGKRLLSHHLPAWLTLDQKTKNIVIIKDKVEVIKYIFKRTLDGIGQKSLCKELNEKYNHLVEPTEKRPNPKWNTSYISALLKDRKVIGELQPRRRNKKGIPEDLGQPIKDYFPPVIKEKDFYAAQTQVAMRRKERYFEKSNFVNLFSGLVFNGADKQLMHLETNKKYNPEGSTYIQRRFKSAGVAHNRTNTSRTTIDYFNFEKIVLLALSELSSEEYTGKFKPNTERTKLLKAITGYKNKEQKLREELTSSESKRTISTITNAIEEIEDKRIAAEQEFESLTNIQKTKPSDLKNITKLPKLFCQKNNEDLDINLRYQLKNVLPAIIKRIELYPYKLKNRTTAAKVRIVFRTGRHRNIHLIKQKQTKTMPMITFFNKRKEPAYALCDCGIVTFMTDYVGGNIIKEYVSQILGQPVRVDGLDTKLKCNRKQFELLQRMIDFCETQFCDASKEGFDFKDPFKFIKIKDKDTDDI